MISRIAWLPAAALLAAAAGAAPAPDAKDEVRILVLPGGVADADGVRGFVRNDTGGLTALDLATGQPLWTSKLDARPLAVRGGRVLVQTRERANVLRIVGLDADKGDKVWESDPITLPDWVRADPGRWGGYSFNASRRLDGSDLFLSWQAATWYWGGAAPSPQTEKAARHNADGVARIDLDSSKVELLDKAPPPPAARFSKEQMEKAAAALLPGAPDAVGRVSVMGDLGVAVELGKDGTKAVLKRYDLAGDKPLDPVVLAEGGPYDRERVIGPGVVLIHRKSGDAAWDVYNVEGKSLGTVPDEPDLTVVGPRAFYVVQGLRPSAPFGGVIPRTLKAVDLKTGKHLWEQPLEGERLPLPPPP